MFGTIRKHQTWLWMVIITFTIVAFVIFFSPNAKMGPGRDVNFGSINGVRIEEQDYQQAINEVNLRWLFMRGEFPGEQARQMGFDPMRQAYEWMFLSHKQKEAGIQVGTEAAAEFARNMVRSFTRDPSITPSEFVKRVLEPRGLTMADFERYVRHYVGIQELIATFGASGKMITPQEAREFYIRENQERSTEVVLLSVSNYVSQVKVTPEAISQFYSNRLSYYRIPERLTVGYVAFPISNFLAQAEAELMKTNINQMVDNVQNQRGTNLWEGAKTIEESKAKIREAIIKETASLQARRKAAEFASPLFVKDAEPEHLKAAAEKTGLPFKTTVPFRRDEGPKDLDAGPDFAKVAFSLTPEEPFGGPLPGEEAWYVITMGSTVPSEIPSLDSIRERVETEYKQSQAMTLAFEAGQKFHSNAVAAVSTGKPISEVATAAGLKTIPLQFSISTRSIPEVEGTISADMLKQLAFSTDPGKVSDFQPSREGGVLVYVKATVPVDEAKLARELPEFMLGLRQTRQNEAFNDWFRREADRGLRDTPIAQPEPATAAKGKAA